MTTRVEPRTRDLALTCAIAAAVGIHVWFVASRFGASVTAGGSLDYVLLGAPPGFFVLPLLAAAALTWGPARRASAGAPRALSPLILLGVAPLAAVNLVPRLAGTMPALTFVLVDLRPWWSLLLVAASALRLDRALDRRGSRAVGANFARLAPDRRLFALDASLFLLVFIWGTATNAHLRFTGVLHGDEVKYLRYCENWYQGLGLEVEHQRSMSDLTPAYAPRLARNLTLFARAAREELRDAASDARAFAREGWSFRFNRARYAEEWFIRGKHGDYYQVHNPGLSVLLFPAWFLDRHFLSAHGAYQDRFPEELRATNLAILLLWSVWAVVIFRFLRAATARDGISWGLAAAAMCSMPVTAFAFQIYPECAAGVILFAVASRLLFASRAAGNANAITSREAVLLGVAVGFLPWLHVRYLLLTLVVSVWGVVTLAGVRRAFVLPFGALLAAMCTYAYHLTGSFRPDAMYEAEGSYAPWRLQDAIQALAAYPFDRIWGLFPHAPIYLCALPGIVILVRRQPSAAALCGLLVAALAVPSAGHGFSAAGATPLRHLVAVIPFAMLPLAWTLMTWAHRRWAQVAVGLALVLSLDTGASYNLHHPKEVGRLLAWNISGWAPNLLFPWTHAQIFQRSWSNFALLLSWVAICVTLLLLPLFARSQSAIAAPQPPARRRQAAIGSLWQPLLAVVIFVIFVMGATIATAMGREWIREDYVEPADEARAATVRYFMSLGRCWVCESSARGRLNRTTLVAGTGTGFEARAEPSEVAAGEAVVFATRSVGKEGAGWGAVTIDFGDGEFARVPDVFGRARIVHGYRDPGTHHVSALFTTTAGEVLSQRFDVIVRPSMIAISAVDGLPDAVARAPVQARIERATVGPAGLVVKASISWGPADVWLLSWHDGRWTAVPWGAAGTRPAGTWTGMLMAPEGGGARSEPVVVDFPSPEVTLGAPVVIFPRD